MSRFTYRELEPAARYYARFRTMPTAEGETIRALTTRYTFERFRKPAGVDDKGVHLYRVCYRSTYYAGGRFYRDANVPARIVDGIPCDHAHVLEPFTGTIYDRFPEQSEAAGFEPVTITCKDGRPVSVATLEGSEIWTADMGDFAPVAAYLALDKQPRKSPRKSAA